MKKSDIKKERELIRKILHKLPTLSPEKQQQILESIEEKRKKLAFYDFYTFLVLFAPYVMPNDYIDGAHVHLFCQKLQEVEAAIDRGGKERCEKYWKKVMFALPPGAMKSVTLNLFIAWCLGRHPNWRVIHISHSIRLVIDNSAIPIKSLLQEPEFISIFPKCQVSEKGDTQDSFRFTEGGAYFCGSSGTKIAGRRYHLAVIDDAVSEQDANSKTERDKINNWYVSGLRSRRQKMHSASEVLVGTRWHLDDLSGHMLKKDKGSKFTFWEEVRFPAVLDQDQAKQFSKIIPEDKEMYVEGGSFWPQLHDIAELEDFKRTNTPAKWSALYMQEPIAEGGSTFERKWFRRFYGTETPECLYTVMSMDTAFSEKQKADYTAITVWGVFEVPEKFLSADGEEEEVQVRKSILLYNEKGRWAFHDLLERAREIHAEFRPDSIIVERASSGHALITELDRYGLPVTPFLPHAKGGDKGVRANIAAPYVRAGSVYIHEIREEDEDPTKGIWCNENEINEFLDEVCIFSPGSSSYDDYVDSMVMALLYLVENNLLRNVNQTDIDREDDWAHVRKRKTYFS